MEVTCRTNIYDDWTNDHYKLCLLDFMLRSHWLHRGSLFRVFQLTRLILSTRRDILNLIIIACIKNFNNFFEHRVY